MGLNNLKEHKPHGKDDFPVSLYDSSWHIPYHWHEEEEIVYMTKGRIDYNIDGHSICLSEGDCAFCRSGRLHSMLLNYGQDVSFSAVVFKLSFVFGKNDICSRLLKGINTNSYFSSKDSKNYRFIKTAKELCSVMSEKPFGYEIISKKLITELFSVIIEDNLFSKSEIIDNTSIKKNILSAVGYIHTNYADKISVDALAAKTGYSPSYFEKFFKQYTKKTPIEYLNSFRMEKAQDLLLNTEYNVLEISLSCGFVNVSYFIRAFKKYFMLTPHQYRKQYSNQ